MNLQNMSTEAVAGLLVAAVVLLSLASSLICRDGTTTTRYTNARGIELWQQAMKWHSTSQQDRNPLFALKHAYYAHAYLEASRYLVSDEVIQQATTKSVYDVRSSILASQEKKLREVKKKMAPPKPHAK